MKLISKIKDLFRINYLIEKNLSNPESSIQKRIGIVERRIVADRLLQSSIYSTDRGISTEPILDKELVVSLTSFGKRIHEVYLTVESIMQGTIKPNRIVLWLGEENRNSVLPVVLQNQLKRGLEIRYCKDIRSYTKLIPSLKSFPDACIVTVDDDVIYEPDLLEHLVNSYREDPNAVSACRIHKMIKDNNGKLCAYMSWKHFCYDEKPSYINFLTGNGGVLYPPHCFSEEVFNEEVFLDICKYADDVWFHAMLIKNGTKVKKAFTHSKIGQDYHSNESENEITLFSGNAKRNDEQIKAVFEKYDLYKKI